MDTRESSRVAAKQQAFLSHIIFACLTFGILRDKSVKLILFKGNLPNQIEVPKLGRGAGEWVGVEQWLSPLPTSVSYPVKAYKCNAEYFKITILTNVGSPVNLIFFPLTIVLICK